MARLERITVLDVWQALGKESLFGQHKKPGFEQCPVGRYSRSVGGTIVRHVNSFRLANSEHPLSDQQPLSLVETSSLMRRISSSARDDAPSLDRVDSEAVLIHAAEPIDRIDESPPRTDEGLYTEPCSSSSDFDNVATAADDSDDVESTVTTTEEVEAATVEARNEGLISRNLRIIIPEDFEEANAKDNEAAVVLEMDNSTSVI